MKRLECRNISYQIAGKVIIEDINFSLSLGDNLLITGPSGCGKTSLLSILSGLAKPSSGEVIFNDMNLFNEKQVDIDHFRGRNIGIIFQTFHLIKDFSVNQNLLLLESMSGKKIDKIWLKEVVNRLGLRERLEQKVRFLSVGEMQRLAVARAVILKPSWIFCDEPTSALDDENTKHLLTLLFEISKDLKSSLVIVTHDQRTRSYFTKEQTLDLVKYE